MYQYHDTILNQVSVSVSRYNLEVSYPTLAYRKLLTADLNMVA